MLVLSRMPGESIVIDDEITVQILQVDGDTIKVGIDAPRCVAIYRKELYEEIQTENQSAGMKPAEDLRGLPLSFQNPSESSEVMSSKESATDPEV